MDTPSLWRRLVPIAAWGTIATAQKWKITKRSTVPMKITIVVYFNIFNHQPRDSQKKAKSAAMVIHCSRCVPGSVVCESLNSQVHTNTNNLHPPYTRAHSPARAQHAAHAHSLTSRARVPRARHTTADGTPLSFPSQDPPVLQPMSPLHNAVSN